LFFSGSSSVEDEELHKSKVDQVSIEDKKAECNDKVIKAKVEVKKPESIEKLSKSKIEEKKCENLEKVKSKVEVMTDETVVSSPLRKDSQNLTLNETVVELPKKQLIVPEILARQKSTEEKVYVHPITENVEKETMSVQAISTAVVESVASVEVEVPEKTEKDSKVVEEKAEASFNIAETPSSETPTPKLDNSDKQLLKKWRKQKKPIESANKEPENPESKTPVKDQSGKVVDLETEIEDASTTKEEEEFENMGYVSGDDATNYTDENYPKEVNPAIAKVAGHVLKVKETVATATVTPVDSTTPPLERKDDDPLTTAKPISAEKQASPVKETVVEKTVELSLPVEKDVEIVTQQEQQQDQDNINQIPTDIAPTEISEIVQEEETEISRPSCALENLPHQQQQHQQHMATTDSTSTNLGPSLGVYTPDSATNSVHSMHGGYSSQNEIGTGDSMHSNIMESPNSISSVEAVSIPQMPVQQQQQQQQQQQMQQQHHNQSSYVESLLSQQQPIKQSLVPPFAAYGAPGPHHQVPTPPSPSIAVANHHQQQQQQMSSPLMSAAPSPHQSHSIPSASPHSQHNMTSPHPQPSPLSSPHPMTISPAAHSPYATHVPQPSPQGLPSAQQQNAAVRQASRSPATHSVQHHQQQQQQQQNTAANQMHQFQQLQRNLWQNYNPMNVAAAMGMTQQAACHLNRQLAAANFQAGAGMFPPSAAAAGMFTPPNMSLAASGIASSVTSPGAQKQHPSSHATHHGAMAPQQNSFYGQMANHHPHQVSSGQNRSAAVSAGCIAKLQQLTNGLESTGVPTSSSSNQPSSSSQNNGGVATTSNRSASSKQAARNAAAEQAARNAAAEQAARNAAEQAARNAAAEQAARNAAAAEQAARNAALIPSGYAYPTSHQGQSGPTPPPPSHTPSAGAVPAGYYGRTDMGRSAATGHPGSGASSISANHLMQQYGQNAAHHHMLNYTAGYGFMNQFMYHAAAASDHQRNSAATPQPGTHGPAPPHPQHMYPGYPHLGYPTNYHR
jgi:hypothetical protein